MVFRRLTYILFAGVSLLLSSCSDDEGLRVDSDQAFVQVRIGISGNPAAMRGTPSGGDDGDGREAGINNENKVYGVNLLLFDKDVKQAENASAPVKRVLYFGADELKSIDDFNYELKEPYRMVTDYTTYYVVAVVNDHYDYTGKTFSEIADMVVKKPWQGNGNTADHFVMTSTHVATLDIVKNNGTKGTYGDPYMTNIQVERLAARVDIDSEGGSTGFVYDYKNDGGTVIGTVTIKDIQAFNLLNDGTYLLKHFSTDGTLAKLNFFGSEGISPTQSQYVLDPHTLAKTTAATPAYYTKPFAGITDLATGISWETPTLLADQTVASGVDAGHKYMILTYLQENTLPKMTTSESTTMLPKYGTVLAIHYQVNDGTPEDRYDYYYLKHNAGATTPAVTDPMAFSIVRNNIYRVSLVPPVKGGSPTLTIKVKVWDKFTHSWIYM